ncbi:MAG: DUF4012 domain-containing protein [Anaerolineales bacterium]|nr:DUF4012 domain-containing protein [Anaerolineales bacterium]
METVTTAFRKMIPPGPPRAGKRMDTRWGTFGILAAQYFAPLALGIPFPTSLREAWESMDRSILFFACGRVDGLSEVEIARYRFAGNELEPAPNSTLSDWHRKGLEQLTEMTALELKRKSANPKSVLRKRLLQAAAALGLLTLLAIAFLGWETGGLYQHALSIEQKADALEAYLNPTTKLEQIPEIAIKVHDLSMDIDALQSETEPYLWMAAYCEWIPQYGGTLSQADDLLALAQNLASASDEGLTAITPIIKTSLQNNQPLEMMDLLLQLQEASPQLLDAQVMLAQAQAARERIDAERLTPKIKRIVTERIDPLFESISGAFPMEDALTLVSVAPKLLGSGKAGPQTYLILMQNEDELRPTGGFLTAVSSAVLKDGKLIGINFESSELVDDFSKPYPIPPWQFEEFMNIEMLLFRDSNWFTDFPTTVSWAEYFYSYTRAASAYGVIAVDMHVIARLLETLGPVSVDNVSYPITSENVLEYMRSAEEKPPKGVKKGEWDRKQFIGKLAQPLLEKILKARGQTWTKLTPVLMELLDEKHMLLQIDDEEVSKLLERRNWDGAVRVPGNSDYLMVVDTNMGYNKANAVMEMALEYNVDMTALASPASLLRVRQTNRSNVDIPCEPWSTGRYILPSMPSGTIPDTIYNIDECYSGYLRIYTPANTSLLRSTPREIPAESTMLGETIPARTDDLGDEDIIGAQVFGAMIITPTHQTTETEFEYRLPVGVVTQDAEDNKLWTYHLKVQKQPGTLAHPFTLTLRLPVGARIESASISFAENDGAWMTQLDLKRDVWIEVQFRAK